MRCPVCNGDVKVMDVGTGADAVIRRRKCLNCNHLFFTSETIIFNEIGAPLLNKFRNSSNLRRHKSQQKL